MPSSDALEGLSRDQLILRAKALGAQRPELLTRVELCDEILRLSEPDEARRKTSRGWLGVARDLVASVVEAGLNMRDAAAVIRGDARLDTDPAARAPVATVTLAEIYAAQGHVDRAQAILTQVLESEPDHAAALALREKLKRETPTESERRRPVSPARSGAGATTQEPVSPAKSGAGATAQEPVSPPQSGAGATTEEPVSPPQPATAQEPVSEHPAPPADRADEALHEPDQAGADAGVSVLVLWEHALELHLRWHASLSELARREHLDPDGALVIRLVAYAPRREGVERMSRDLVVRGPLGSTTVAGFGARAVIRAALGWSSNRGFLPIAVAAQVDPTSRDEIKLLYEPPSGFDARTVAVARAALSALDAA
jgi:hypothetical protein